MSQHQIRKQIMQNLNYQYKTNKYKPTLSFLSMVQICQQSLRYQLYPTIYQLPSPQIYKYYMKITNCQIDPFQPEQRIFLYQLADVCDKIVCEPGYDSINKANAYIKQDKFGMLKLSKQYKRLQLGFRYVGIKQALIFTALSNCNVWYTICKNRKKSNKQFDLDPLIQYFNQFVTKMKFDNPYHINILPKKQAKNIQRKLNQQKIGNPLYEAVSNGDHKLAKQLLQTGAKIESSSFLNNRQKTQVRCTHRACLNKDLKMCKVLQSFGADWQAEDGQKQTPIFYAIQAGSLQVIRYLVQQIKVNIQKQQIQSRTPFYWACTQGDIEIIDYLYKAGCNINQKSELGRTALSKSCYLGRRDIVVYLLNCKQIDMYSQCKKGRTALHNAVFGPKGGRQGHKFGTNDKDSPQCAQILLQKGMNVDIVDFQDCTALHVATSSQAIDSIRLLLAYGASLTARNNYGQTPIMTAAKFGHVQTCKILYEQYHSDILCIDVFGKNLLLLTAKFQINSDQQIGINPAYMYFLQPFILQCKKQNKLDELYRTFKEQLLSQFAEKMIIELTQLWKGFKKYQIPKPELGIKEIEKILQISMNKAPKILKDQLNNQAPENLGLQFAMDLLKNIQLPQQKLHQIHLWLIKYNQPKILQFVFDNDLLSLNKFQIPEKKLFQLFQNDQLNIKQKVVTFCLMCVNFDWIKYRNEQNCNILHLLVRKQRSGCIVQLFKALSGRIPAKMLVNKYVKDLTQEQCKKVLQDLLWEKDQSGLDAHQLSLILKNKSVAKLIQQKLKQQNLQFSSVLDVREYEPVLETDPVELQIFNSHERQEQLCEFEQKVKNLSNQQLSNWFSYGKVIQPVLQSLKAQNLLNQAHQKFWKQIQNRPLHFLSYPKQLQILHKLSNEPVIGIDLQYFSYESTTMISIFQISSLTQDYIIDCLNIELREIKKYIQDLLYNEKIIKIMHGADNDLILIKSLFNLSVINFVDTSRLDIELRQNKHDLRGLATLCKDYLGATLSKQYQVSEWRIRPIPKAMQQYAKKDSMILPILLIQMINKIADDPQRIRMFIIGGCKQARRNKKVNQPLIKAIRVQ